MREYHPELIPRRGEWTAWSLAAVAGITWAVLKWRVPEVPGAALIFVLFLCFSAFSISLGNWMDRQTVMTIDDDGIKFRNGLRKADLTWQQIKEVRVLKARWGERIQVIGEKSHFEFRTLGEVEFQGELKGRMGFTEGKAILEEILDKTGLQETSKTDKAYYYSRT